MNKKICIGMLFAAMALAACGGSGATDADDVSSSNTGFGDYDPSTGILTDSPDGQKYKTTEIGTRTWMAENLNIATEGSWCYDDDPANCEKYGRLYTWAAAQKVCPSGWHLPSKEDFESLLDKVGSSEGERSENLRDSFWSDGKNEYGFSALPAGLYLSDDKEFIYLGSYAYFWSSTENDEGHAFNLFIGGYSARVDGSDKNSGSSVRCLKDN